MGRVRQRGRMTVPLCVWVSAYTHKGCVHALHMLYTTIQLQRQGQIITRTEICTYTHDNNVPVCIADSYDVSFTT